MNYAGIYKLVLQSSVGETIKGEGCISISWKVLSIEVELEITIQMILSLLDNWSNPGGIDQLVAWSGTAKSRQDFFTDPNCMQLYKQHVKTVISRVNTINGRKYQSCPNPQFVIDSLVGTIAPEPLVWQYLVMMF